MSKIIFVSRLNLHQGEVQFITTQPYSQVFFLFIFQLFYSIHFFTNIIKALQFLFH